MINNISGYPTSAGLGVNRTTAGQTAGAGDIGGARDEKQGTVSISTLAGQLAYSAGDAAARNQGLSHTELGAKAERMVDQILYELTPANAARFAAETPKTSDPALLKRAQLATAFVNGGMKDNVGSEPNPFAGLSREQLANITYDESGAFTVNERRAAFSESYRLEEQWRVKVVAQMQDEYGRTGKLTDFFKEILDHYNGLPAMEQAQYPENYALDLGVKIKLDFNYRTGKPGAAGDAGIESLLGPKMMPIDLFPARK